jgi:hypothetical protein
LAYSARLVPFLYPAAGRQTGNAPVAETPVQALVDEIQRREALTLQGAEDTRKLAAGRCKDPVGHRFTSIAADAACRAGRYWTHASLALCLGLPT